MREPSKRLLIGDARELGVLLGWTPPTTPNTAALTPDGTCLWLRPDQWLLLDGAIAPMHSPRATILDASARWRTFTATAAQLAAGCSLDLRSRSFAAGQCAQTRVEQVPVILLRKMGSDPNCNWGQTPFFDVLVERPLAHHFETWLHLVGDQ